MLEYWEKIMERPKWQQVTLWIGSLVFMSFVFWEYMYSSQIDSYSKLSDKMHGLETQLATETAIVNNLPRFKKEVEKLNGLYEVAVQKLPQKREIPTLLESVSNLAKDSGLDVRSFAPRPDTIKDFFAEIPVDVEMQGTFHKVATFFDELAHMSRIVNVQDIALTNPRGYRDTEGVDVDVKGVLKTYRYLEKEERIHGTGQTEDAKSERGKRK